MRQPSGETYAAPHAATIAYGFGKGETGAQWTYFRSPVYTGSGKAPLPRCWG
ncbi:hypothetical protein GCM10010277_68770 [Streptomyces longisporoflavus]|nr:hypothetical protein GCM10010277_68770 [Streptomyces longisporoflavus]